MRRHYLLQVILPLPVPLAAAQINYTQREDTMDVKRFLPPILVITLIFIGTAGATCNPAYVLQSSNTVSVLPTGSDDTENLRCAFDYASTISGVVLQLGKGTYITGRIVVDGFHGTVRGTGMDKTIIRNPDIPIYVTPDDFYMVPPKSPDFAPPFLICFLGGDYTVTDLTLSIVGANPVTDWSIFGIRNWLGHGLTSMAGPVVILGSATSDGYREANASFERVFLKGEPSDDPLVGYNSINGIYYEGFAGPELLPLKGMFKVSDSVFQYVGSSTPVLNLVDSRVSLTRNKASNVVFGGELVDLRNTIYEFARNQVTGVYGLDMYDNCYGAGSNCGMSASNVLIKNNLFRTVEGVWLDPVSFLNGTNPLVLGNNFSKVSDVAVYLGPGTSNTTVVGTGNGSVVNFGTNNSITSMTKVAGAQGQRIKTLLQMTKGGRR